jgi:hypothetical protein
MAFVVTGGSNAPDTVHYAQSAAPDAGAATPASARTEGEPG